MWLAFRNQLPQYLQDELDHLIASVRSFLFTEHQQDGTHAAVTADAVTIRAGGAVTLEDLGSLEGDVREAVMELKSAGTIDLITTYEGTQELALTLGADPQSGQTGREDQFHRALAARVLRLNPQSSYAASLNDTSALVDSPVTGPAYSVYRITSGSIEGIYTSGFTPTLGQRGQVIVVINDKGSDMNIATLGAVTNQNKILGGPLVLQDGGSATFLYDNDAQGWRIVASNLTTQGVWQSYTSTWSSASNPQPSIGNGSLVASYTKIGKTVHVRIQLLAGTTTTYGTGAWSFSLPVTAASAAAPAPCIGSGLIRDDSAGNFFNPVIFLSTTTVLRVLPSGTGGSVGPTTPMTWASSDYLTLTATYEGV